MRTRASARAVRAQRALAEEYRTNWYFASERAIPTSVFIFSPLVIARHGNVITAAPDIYETRAPGGGGGCRFEKHCGGGCERELPDDEFTAGGGGGGVH